MQFNKRDMIERLKLEISIIRDGGYSPSVREPRKEPRIFRDSITCLNVGLEEGMPKKEPCTNCVFADFVPAEHREGEYPCYHIPLNSRGDTVACLQGQGDKEKLESALLTWLYKTVAKLEKEVAKGE